MASMAKEKEAAEAKGIKDESGVVHTRLRVTFKDGKPTFKVLELVPATEPKKP